MADKSSQYHCPKTMVSSVSEDDQEGSQNDVEANVRQSPNTDSGDQNHQANNNNSSTKSKSKLNYINSGPMSEGHIRMYSSSPARLSDFSQNICLFNKCLLLVGVTTIAIGINVWFFQQSPIVAIVLVAIGSFSVSSAVIYTLAYMCTVGLTKARGNSNTYRNQKSANSSAEQRTKLNSASNGNFSHFVEYSDGTVQIVNLNNERDDSDSSESQQPINNNYCDNSLLLNVDNLNYDIMSTEHLDQENWKTTTNGEIPQNYLNSFGEVPKIFSSPTLIDEYERSLSEHDDRDDADQINPLDDKRLDNANDEDENNAPDNRHNSNRKHQLDDFASDSINGVYDDDEDYKNINNNNKRNIFNQFSFKNKTESQTDLLDSEDEFSGFDETVPANNGQLVESRKMKIAGKTKDETGQNRN